MRRKMKLFDDVRVINDCKEYAEAGVFKGMVGYIDLAEIRDNSFFVCFEDEDYKAHENDLDWIREHFSELKGDFSCIIKIEDLELVKDNGCTDKQLLRNLPKKDPHWWCKVENGYILNLLNEKKNKIPYNYNS